MHIRVRKWVKITIAISIIIVSLILYSRYIGTKGIIVKEYKIIDSNLPENFYGLKIVHISDIHYKVTTDDKDLKKIVNEINLLKPDIVILTGDLFNKNIKYTDADYENISNILKDIKYSIGKYAIKGEQDLNNNNWDEVILNSDFNNLNDSYELLYKDSNNPILLIGISSNYKENHIEKTLNDIYSNINAEYNFSILVLHEPDFISDIDYSRFNLILAGHTLGGQIRLPYTSTIFKNKYSKKYYKDYYEFDNTKLYISTGIGTNKYKFRLFNRPSINFYRLRNK